MSDLRREIADAVELPEHYLSDGPTMADVEEILSARYVEVRLEIIDQMTPALAEFERAIRDLNLTLKMRRVYGAAADCVGMGV